jgi:hypothetical protein
VNELSIVNDYVCEAPAVTVSERSSSTACVNDPVVATDVVNEVLAVNNDVCVSPAVTVRERSSTARVTDPVMTTDVLHELPHATSESSTVSTVIRYQSRRLRVNPRKV